MNLVVIAHLFNMNRMAAIALAIKGESIHDIRMGTIPERQVQYGCLLTKVVLR